MSQTVDKELIERRIAEQHQLFTKEFRSPAGVSFTTKFGYACALSQSSNPAQLQLAVRLFEDLERNDKDPSHLREYIYFLARCHLGLGHLTKAKDTIKRLLAKEPTNRQALHLLEEIDERLQKDGLTGLAIVGGVAAIAAITAGFLMRK